MSKTTTETATDNKTFFAQYKDARWQKKRLEIMQRDGFACRLCGIESSDDATITLNVHHAFYIKGNKPWEYPDEHLCTYCEECHKRIHDLKRKLALFIANSSWVYVEALELRFLRTSDRTLWDWAVDFLDLPKKEFGDVR